MKMIDFEQVKRSVTLQTVLRILGLPVPRMKWPRFKGPCPLRCGFNNQACNYQLHKNVWFCHRCHKGGNQLDLYVQVTRLDLAVAAFDLCNRAGVPVPVKIPTGPPCLREPKASDLNTLGSEPQ